MEGFNYKKKILEQSDGHMSISLQTKSFMIPLHMSALTLGQGLCNQPKWHQNVKI
jgi:hypothetical protein